MRLYQFADDLFIAFPAFFTTSRTDATWM